MDAPRAGAARRGRRDAASHVRLRWQLASRSRSGERCASGGVAALPELAHSVHVEVHGLRSGREYYYQFRTTATAGRPHPDSPASRDGALGLRVRILPDWAHGFYIGYRNMAEEDLDLVVHLGDYVYEYGVRPAATATPVPVGRAGGADLARCRIQYALYKSDPTCRRHTRPSPGSSPGTTTRSPTTTPEPRRGRYEPGDPPAPAAAYRAWDEHQPVGRTQLPQPRRLA